MGDEVRLAKAADCADVDGAYLSRPLLWWVEGLWLQREQTTKADRTLRVAS